MNTIAAGTAYVFGNNIDTDQIYPGKYVELTEMEDIRQHAMSGSEEPELVKVFRPGDIIVAGTNFGCGSSREHAAMTLKGIAVGAILAESFGRIFYRNAINLGIPAITCKGIHSLVKRGDKVRIDFTTGEIINETTGATAKAEPMNEYMMSILQNGGIKPMIRKMLEKQ
ncbi:MAG: 3-isopropylmalate dehydratase small subunit [Acidaminococcaceae bacterium]|nr:3-isopropylmalate dehydratase small subunit [Acidaminococcaceae bacterium]